MRRYFSPISRIAAVLALVSGMVVEVSAWDELGPLPKARGAHPEFFQKGAVREVEIEGVPYWIFTGDSLGGSSLPDAEAYREAALDARRNLLRHLTGGAARIEAEASGIATAYRFADGKTRRVVCLVPVENVSIHTNAPSAGATPPPPQPAPPSGGVAAPPPAQPAPAPGGEAAPPPAQPAPAPGGEAAPFGQMPRFTPPNLPTPSIP